jgi:hypothetical protein
MSVDTNLVLPEKFADRVTPFFESYKDFLETRDKFYEEIRPELEELNDKRRKSEEAAQVKKYR